MVPRWSHFRIAAVALILLLPSLSLDAQTRADALPDLPATGVVVPWEDFKQILEEIRRPGPDDQPPPPPVPWAMSACTATVSVGEDPNRVRAVLVFEVEVLDDRGWVEVPVVGDGVALSAVSLDGRAASVFRREGHHRLALRGAGRHRITLEYLAPVTAGRGTSSARLVLPQAPVVTVVATVPRIDVDVVLDNAVIRSIDRSNGRTTVQAALLGARSTIVSWFGRVDDDDRETTVFGELGTVLSVGEGVVRGHSTAAYTIHGRGVSRVRLEVPATMTVLEVNGAGVDRWAFEAETEAEADRRVLSVDLNHRAEGSASLGIEFEMPLGGTSAEVDLPDIALLDVLRERGFLAVVAATSVEVSPVGEIENAAPIDPTELPAVLMQRAGAGVLYAFKYLRHPVRVRLEVVRHRDVAMKRTLVESADLHTYVGPHGRALTAARYTVRSNRTQYLVLQLPERAELWSASLEGRPVKAARRSSGEVLVPLKTSALDASGRPRPFDVEVVYLEDGSRLRGIGRWSIRAPALDVDAMEVRWRLYLPRDHRYVALGGSLEEAPAANQLAYLGGTVYNLARPEDVARLKVWKDGEQTVVGNEMETVDLDKFDVREADEESGRRMLEKKLEGGEMPAKVPVPDPTPDHERPAATQQIWADRSQVANVAQGVEQIGGRARGMLPVKISVPTDGVRLDFVGRLVAADTAPDVGFTFLPAGWRAPRIGGAMVFVLASLLAVVCVLAAIRAREGSATAGMVVAVVCILVLALFAISGGHRMAFWLGVLTGGGGAWAIRSWWTRLESGGGF